MHHQEECADCFFLSCRTDSRNWQKCGFFQWFLGIFGDEAYACAELVLPHRNCAQRVPSQSKVPFRAPIGTKPCCWCCCCFKILVTYSLWVTKGKHNDKLEMDAQPEHLQAWQVGTVRLRNFLKQPQGIYGFLHQASPLQCTLKTDIAFSRPMSYLNDERKGTVARNAVWAAPQEFRGVRN